jgi:hypothetical protein
MRAVWPGLLAAALAVLTAAPAAGAYEIADFRGAVYRDGVQDETNDADEAGEHPDTGIVEFAFTTNDDGSPSGVTKELRIDIPAGLIPNPARSARGDRSSGAPPRVRRFSAPRSRARSTSPRTSA